VSPKTPQERPEKADEPSASPEGVPKDGKELALHQGGTQVEVLGVLQSPEQSLERQEKRYRRQVSAYIRAVKSDKLFYQTHPQIQKQVRRLEMDKLAMKAVLAGSTMTHEQKLQYLLDEEHEVNRGIVKDIGGALMTHLEPWSKKEVQMRGGGYGKFQLGDKYREAIEEERYDQEVQFNPIRQLSGETHYNKAESAYDYLMDQGRDEDNKKWASLIRTVTTAMGRLISAQKEAQAEAERAA
jgi:hypothetical protein